MNPEKAIADYLRAAGHRVVVQTPSDTSTSWVLLTQLGAPSRTAPDYLFEVMVQLDCYAGKDGGQPEAVALGWACRGLLDEIAESDFGAQGLVMTGSRNVGHARRPDTDLKPARQRVIVTELVWLHGVPS